jgi:hypothetical protein
MSVHASLMISAGFVSATRIVSPDWIHTRSTIA